MGLIRALICAIFGLSLHKRCYGWNYEDQDGWPQFECSGRRQSPIDILTPNTQPSYHNKIAWKNNATQFGFVLVKNNGHGFSVKGETLKTNLLYGGGLKARYKLAQFHYHWGPTDTPRARKTRSVHSKHENHSKPKSLKHRQSKHHHSSYSGRPHHQGSEHRVDGRQWPAELHLVHFREDFPDISAALKSNQIDALAVVGVLLKREKRSPIGHEESLLHAVEEVPSHKDSRRVHVGETTIHHLIPHDLTAFYRYDGSLTTPTCNEQVIWTVLQEEKSISNELLDAFVHIKDLYGNALNYTGRDPQPINSRIVFRNGPPLVQSHKPTHHKKQLDQPKIDVTGSSLVPFLSSITALLALAVLLLLASFVLFLCLRSKSIRGKSAY